LNKLNSYTLSDLAIGFSETFKAKLDLQSLNAFIEISGDKNPLHCNKSYAKKNGFYGPVVHGMLSSSFYSQLVGVHLPGKYSILQGIDIDFVKPIYIENNLIVTGSVTFISIATKRIEIKASIKNENNEKLSRAKIRVGLLHE
tara:strand:+ start:19 stop:447 length:429 start_codon:yes stop_codon:yes gene_type:complete